MNPEHESPEEKIARLKEDLCPSSGSAAANVVGLINSYPMTFAAVALAAGFIAGFRPSLIPKAFGLGGWLLKSGITPFAPDPDSTPGVRNIS